MASTSTTFSIANVYNNVRSGTISTSEDNSNVYCSVAFSPEWNGGARDNWWIDNIRFELRRKQANGYYETIATYWASGAGPYNPVHAYFNNIGKYGTPMQIRITFAKNNALRFSRVWTR